MDLFTAYYLWNVKLIGFVIAPTNLVGLYVAEVTLVLYDIFNKIRMIHKGYWNQ